MKTKKRAARRPLWGVARTEKCVLTKEEEIELEHMLV
jgi:hypothetical protein